MKFAVLLFLTLNLLPTDQLIAQYEPHHGNKGPDSGTVSVQAEAISAPEALKNPPMLPPIAEIQTAHSAVVHFPLVLLLVAAIFQVIYVFRPRRGLSWQVMGLTIGGFAGAYVANSVAHPHTTGLSQSAMHALEHHEQLAKYTLWLAGAGLILKLISLWRSYRWLDTITAVILIRSVYFVMHTSHMGGELLYRYGVGPRGAYLETPPAGRLHSDKHDH